MKYTLWGSYTGVCNTLGDLKSTGGLQCYGLIVSNMVLVFPLLQWSHILELGFFDGGDLRWMNISVMAIILAISILSVCSGRPR